MLCSPFIIFALTTKKFVSKYKFVTAKLRNFTYALKHGFSFLTLTVYAVVKVVL